MTDRQKMIVRLMEKIVEGAAAQYELTCLYAEIGTLFCATPLFSAEDAVRKAKEQLRHFLEVVS